MRGLDSRKLLLYWTDDGASRSVCSHDVSRVGGYAQLLTIRSAAQRIWGMVALEYWEHSPAWYGLEASVRR